MCNVMFYDYCLCYTMTNIFIKKLFENISTAILLSSSAFYALNIQNAKYVQQSPNLITSPSQRTRALNWRRNLPFFPSHLRTLIAKVLCQEEFYQCCNYVKGSNWGQTIQKQYQGNLGTMYSKMLRILKSKSTKVSV